MEPPLRQEISEEFLVDLCRARDRHQKFAQPDAGFPMFFRVLRQQRIGAVPEQVLFAPEMLLDGIEQIVPHDGKPADEASAIIRHAVDDLAAEAQYHLVLIVDHPISHAIAALPVRKILLTHDQPRLIDWQPVSGLGRGQSFWFMAAGHGIARLARWKAGIRPRR